MNACQIFLFCGGPASVSILFDTLVCVEVQTTARREINSVPVKKKKKIGRGEIFCSKYVLKLTICTHICISI